MSRKKCGFTNRSEARDISSGPEIIRLFDSPPIEEQSTKPNMEVQSHASKLSSLTVFSNLKEDWKKKLLYPILGFTVLSLLVIGVMGKQGWLPSTDALSGKKTGWFGSSLPQNASSSWNPMAEPLPTATPQLSKEYIYAGSRMLAVEDAGASAVPPADLAVWRKTSGMWYVMGANNSIIQTQTQFGATGDIPIQGDYDGDGKTDFATFRPSDNTWYIMRSSGGDTSYYGEQFSISGDKPVVADFDGDGRTDVALYRPSTGTWWFKRSSDQSAGAIQFGLSTDKPAPKDFDGDGKADVAFFRTSDGNFYAFRSSDGTVQTVNFPNTVSTDIPVPADYDGDGKADFAIKRGSSWIIKRSSDNQTQTVNWYPGDVEVPNDYDGDGKVDIAVWRRTDGVWLIRQSSRIGQSDELRAVQWGNSDDIPVPAFYKR